MNDRENRTLRHFLLPHSLFASSALVLLAGFSPRRAAGSDFATTVADYFGHWLSLGTSQAAAGTADQLPKMLGITSVTEVKHPRSLALSDTALA